MTDAPSEPAPISGVLLVDKPAGISSAGVVRLVKGRLRAGGAPKRIKVGHAGTLDPFATGLLVVLVGRATKLQDRYMAGRKGYTATVDLSAFTTTDDPEGEVEPVDVASPPSAETVRAELADRFTGRIEQKPPAFSAIKVGGRRAYALARKGEQVELAARPVVIHAISVTRYAFPELVLEIECGKGTYIRSIARDLGEALGTGGTLSALRRTRVGEHTIDEATPVDDLPDPITPDLLRPASSAEPDV